MYFERRLWRLVENFVPRLSDPQALVEMVSLGGKFVRRLEISELMPPVLRTGQQELAQTDDGTPTGEYHEPSQCGSVLSSPTI